MVNKTSHRGVQSGNTLRAFRHSRRYHNQACIVFRVRPELLQKLAGAAGKADDKKLETNNTAVNVALSLNKKARWLLPSALICQIQSHNIIHSKLTVSLLERHKLTRRANCVSFYSNKGDVKPGNGRYFSFRFPSGDGKSRRAVRRERRQELLELRKTSKPSNIMGKTVEVFTEQGHAKKPLEIGKSEVRYEVYYPAPAQSSILHIPKYIKQDVFGSAGDGDEHVLRGKPKKQHHRKQRKRMFLKDIDDIDLPSYLYDQSLTTVTHTYDHEESSSLDDAREEQTTTEYLLRTLIEKAQQLQNFKRTTKSRRRRKSEKTSSQHEEEKSHIVYVSESQEHELQSENSHQPSPVMHPVSPFPSESTRVLLPKEDVTMASLKDFFGKNYFEAACRPRKFVLDITLNVRELLKKQGLQAKVADKIDDALSYLVCIHDGFYNDEYDVYRVLLNSKLHQGLLVIKINVEKHQGLYRGTVMNLISQTMDFVEGLVINLTGKNHFPVFCENPPLKSSSRHLDTHLGSAEAYVPCLQRLFQTGSAVSGITMPTLSDMLKEDPVLCDVCYNDISPLAQDSASATSLLKCKHHICDSCWSQHIHTRLHEGFVRLTCPGYDCQEEVKVGVLLSVVALNSVDKLLQRQEEVRIGASPTEKWCPNESCGRVICLQPSTSNGQPQYQQDVVCACGAHVCFQCLMPAHWPASCKQAEDYRTNLTTAAFPDRLAEVYDDFILDQEVKLRRQQEKNKTMLVEGKHCPKCKSFVLKNGGCPQMTCRCGQLFCWYCTKPGFSHPTRIGCVKEAEEKKLTTTVLVRHLEVDKSQEDTKAKKPSPSMNRRQRVSLIERAVEHRQHHQKKQPNVHAINTLAKSVAAAAAKNKDLAQNIIKVCSEAFPSSSTNPSVLEIVTAFLKNAARSKLELHEVVEYSLVLLKDLPDSLLRRRALRISEDLGAFCSFARSVFDAWSNINSNQGHQQEAAVKAVMRLAEIQGWIQSALDTHVVTVRKLRSRKSPLV